MRIRAALPADAPSIAAVVRCAYAGYVESLGVRPAPMDDDYDAKVRKGQVFVIEREEGIVGVIVVLSEEDHVLIENVAVAPNCQREGLGRALLVWAESFARDAGTPELRLYTNAGMTENIALYRHFGYREIERRSSGPFRRVFFSKRLDSAAD